MRDEVRDVALVNSIEAFYTGGSVLWSSDGKTIFTTCGNIVKALDVDTRIPRYIVGEVDDPQRVTCVANSHDGTCMYVAYSNGIVRRYALPTVCEGTITVSMLRQWKSTHTAPILTMQCSHDGTLLATGSADSTVKVWNMESQCCEGYFKGTAAVSEILFVDGERVLVGFANGNVSLFHLHSEQKVTHQWKNHSSQIVGLVRMDGTTVGVVSRDQTLSVVNYESGEKVKVLPLFEPVECAIIVDDFLITVGEEGTLKQWHSQSAKLIRSLQVSSSRIEKLLYNGVRKEFLLATCDCNIYLVDARTMKVNAQMVGFNDEIFDFTFVGANEARLAVAANSPEIRIYDTRSWSCTLLPGHKESVLCLCTALWNNELFASSSKDNSLIVWNLIANGNEQSIARKVAVATGHTNSVTSVRFSNSSKRKFIVSVSNDTTIKLWSLAGLAENAPDCVKLSASSTLVAHSKDITCVDVSTNDRLCVSGSMDKTAKLWHIDSDKMQFGIAGTLGGHRRGIWDAKFSDSTQVVATCCGDFSVRIFSVSNRECIATLLGHSSAILKGAFMNNGKQFLSADSGGILKIWSISAKECITTVDAHDDKIWAMLVTGDESKLLTAGSDGRIRVWEDVTEKKLEEEERLRAAKARDEQTLSNLIEQQRFSEALNFSLTLSRPYNCLKVVSALVESGGSELLTSVAKLEEEELVVLLNFASQWNTNSRTANISQQVLNCIFRSFTADQLLKSPNFASVVESLIPYTNRHFERLSRLRQNCAFLDFTWSQMRLRDVPNLLNEPNENAKIDDCKLESSDDQMEEEVSS